MSSQASSKKPILVIIPGWGGTRKTWADFIDLAKNHFEVICVELPCFGDETCPSEVWGIEEYSDFIKSKILNQKSKIQITKIRSFIILGHSFGGQIAAHLAATNPSICDLLILSGPAIFRKGFSMKRGIFWFAAKLGTIILRIPGLQWLASPARKILYKIADSPDYCNTEGIKKQIFQKIIRQDMSAYLPKISMRTLVVAGKKDSFVPLRLSRKVSRSIPSAEFTLIPDGRHGLHRQDPAGLLRIIKTFSDKSLSS